MVAPGFFSLVLAAYGEHPHWGGEGGRRWGQRRDRRGIGGRHVDRSLYFPGGGGGVGREEGKRAAGKCRARSAFWGRFLLRMFMDCGNSSRVKRGKLENSPAL